MQHVLIYHLPLAITVALLLSIYARAIAIRTGLIDFPEHRRNSSRRKIHKKATPLMGGSVVLIPIFAVAAVDLFYFQQNDFAMNSAYFWIVVSCLGCYLLGLGDDLFDLPATLRLSFMFFVLTVAMTKSSDILVQGLHFSSLEVTVQIGSLLSILLSLIVLTGYINAVNLADGKNGLVIGMSLIWTLLLTAYAPQHMIGLLVTLAVVLVIALIFNWKGRFFLGDGGSYGIATLIGLLSIYIYNQSSGLLSIEIMLVWFLIPVIDTLRLMAQRIFKGVSPFIGDREHFHHHLHRVLGWPKGVYCYLSIVALPAVATLIWPDQGLAILLATTVIYLIALVATSRTVGRVLESFQVLNG